MTTGSTAAERLLRALDRAGILDSELITPGRERLVCTIATLSDEAFERVAVHLSALTTPAPQSPIRASEAGWVGAESEAFLRLNRLPLPDSPTKT